MTESDWNLTEPTVLDAEGELPSNAWMVRPCECYKEEYSDCKSIKARFHQYFVFGKSIECDQWLNDFRNCRDFRKTKNINSLEKVIESELARKQERLKLAKENDVWELRNQPPDDWNAPLPKWLAEKKKNSFLEMASEKSSDGLPVTSSFSGFRCVIS